MPRTATALPLVGAVLHFDARRALELLDHDPGWEAGEPPETFPSDL